MFKKTLDSILSKFATAVEDLEELAANNAQRATEKADQVEALKAEIADLDQESAQAIKVASNIRNLLEMHV